MKRTMKLMERGQILLITLLVMAFAVTVAISIISRSTTDVAISNQMESSAEAFSAAEAGIEAGMSTGNSSVETLTSGTKYNVTVASVGGAVGAFSFPNTTKENTETVWLASHNPDGTLNETPVYKAQSLDVCWTEPGTVVPGMVVTILYKSGGTTYRVAKAAFDPNAARAATDKFSAPTSAVANTECGTGDFRARITFSDYGINPAIDTLLMLRLRPVYSDTTISMNSTDATYPLPLQGKQVVSVGSSPDGSTRKIIVFQQYRSAESFFDAALFSQANLIK